MKSLSVVIVAAAVVLSTGCWQKKKKPVVPPAPVPATQPAPAAAPKSAEPAATPAVPPKSPTHKPKVQPAPRPQTTVPAPTTATPAPQLGAMVPAGQRQQLDAVYAADLKKARAVLSAIRTTPLDAQRSEIAGRVRSFIKQAEEFHALDLAAAAEMAQRARVLAEDLERRSK